MVNMFLIKKWAALIIAIYFSAIGFFIGLKTFGLLGGIGVLVVCSLISILLANLMLKNPFSAMVEGKGVLVFDISSTGIIQPFIVKVVSPYIIGKKKGEQIKDVFDRQAVYNLAPPKKAGKAIYTENNGLNLQLSEDEFNKGRMAMFHYPALMYNSQIKSIITKDVISDTEKSMFAEHSILFLNKSVEELASLTRDFARYVIEKLKPQGLMKGSTIAIIIAVVFVIILLIVLLPKILPSLFEGIGTASEGLKTAAASGSPITPRG